MVKRVKAVEGVDVFGTLMQEYGVLLQEVQQAEAALTAATTSLEKKRQELLRFAVEPIERARTTQPAPAVSTAVEARTRHTKMSHSKKAGTSGKPVGSWASRIENQDPRVRRSLSELCQALESLGGRSHISTLAKKIGVTREAVQFRLVRAKRLKIVKSLGKGTYALPKQAA